MIACARRFIVDHPGWILVGIWVVFVSWRPLVLGFYGDDWISIVEELAVKNWGFAELQEVYRSRSGWNVFAAVMGPIAGADEKLWHAIGAVIVGAAMTGVYHFVLAGLSRLSLGREAATRGAVFAACCWVLFPWGIAITVWPETYAVALGVGFVCLSSACLLDGDLPSFLRWPGAVLGFAAACLIYEAFWGFYIPVLMIAYAAGDRRRALIDAIPMTVAQAALIGFNRWIASQDPSAKSLAPDWPVVFVKSVLVHLPFEMANSAGLTTILVAAGGMMIFVAAWPPARRGQVAPRVYVAVVAALCGIAGSCLIFALGGYRLAGNDQAGTTFAAVNIWLAMLLGLGAGISVAGRAGAAIARRSGPAILLLGLVIINPLRVADWARGWAFEKAVLDAVPIQDLMRMPKGGTLLADLPRPPRTVAGFHASWVLRRTIAMKYPGLFEHIPHIAVANSHIWFSRWDGRRLFRGNCNDPDRPFYRHDMPPPLIYWRFGEGLRVFDSPPVSIGCKTQRPGWHRLLGFLYPFAENPFDL